MQRSRSARGPATGQHANIRTYAASRRIRSEKKNLTANAEERTGVWCPSRQYDVSILTPARRGSSDNGDCPATSAWRSGASIPGRQRDKPTDETCGSACPDSPVSGRDDEVTSRSSCVPATYALSSIPKSDCHASASATSASRDLVSTVSRREIKQPSQAPCAACSVCALTKGD